MSENPVDFFSFIFEPITTFFGQLASFLTAGTAQLLEILIKVGQGIIDFLQAIIQGVSGG